MIMNVNTIDSCVDQVLLDMGFVRAQHFVYNAPWSSPEVEHFLYIGRDLKRNDVLVADFGMRNDAAEIFSCNAIRAYGGDVFKLFRCAEPSTCMMRFSFSRLDPKQWPVHLSSCSENNLDKYLRDFLSDLLIPKINKVTTLEEFLWLLTSDLAYCPWVASNGAIRAAQIVALAGQIGLDVDHVHRLLEPRLVLIAHGIAKKSEMRANPIAYINKILADWTTGSLRSLLVQ